MKNKSVIKNSFYYVLYRLVNVLYPLVTATYVSRVLEPDGVGEISLAQTIVVFLVACALLGIPNYGVREVSKLKTKEDRGKLFFELFIINAISTLSLIIIYFTLINLFDLNINRNLYNIEGIILILNFINVDWFYQGMEEFKYITIRSCIVKVVSIFAIFIFVKDKSDICNYALIFALAYAGNYIFNLINLRKYINFNCIKKLRPKKHIKNVLLLAITYISNEIYVTIDSIMLGFMSDNTQVGYYSNAMKLIKILINVLTAIGVALLPRISFLRSNNKNKEVYFLIEKIIKILMFITIPSMIGISLVSNDLVVILFGKAFQPSKTILIILSLLIIFRTFSNLFLQILISDNRDKNVSLTYFFAMVLNIILNLIFIPKFEANGAAFASIISEFCILIMLYKDSKKYNPIKFDKNNIKILIVSNVIMSLIVVSISFVKMNLIIKLIVQITSSVFVYILINYILNNEVIIDIIKIIKEKRKNNVIKCRK